jgi:hypothetical protein
MSTPTTTNTIEFMRRHPSPQELGSLRTQFRDNAQGAKGGREGIESYRGAIAGLRKQSLAQALNLATDRLIDVLTRIIDDVAATERFYQTQGRKK